MATKGLAGPKRGKQATTKAKSERIESLRKEKVSATSVAKAATKALTRPLTDQQKRFIQFWAQGETISCAAMRAGYSDNATYCYRLVKDPAILAVYHAEKKKYEVSVQMTRTKVMEGLLEGIEMGKMIADPNAVIRGWREVGLMCGYYAPVQKKITIEGNMTFQKVERMDDATLLKLIKGEISESELGDVLDVDFTESQP
jgi:hypothetical protein